MLEHLRGLGQALVSPLARLLLRCGVSPSTVTWLGSAAVCLVAVITISQGWLWQGALAIGALSLADLVDGAMARIGGRESRWGAFLDSSLDRLSDAAVFGSVVIYLSARGDELGAVLALGALACAQLTPYVKARAGSLGIDAGGGPAARADRLAIALLALLVAGLGEPRALPAGMGLLTVLGIITVAVRMGKARTGLAERSSW